MENTGFANVVTESLSLVEPLGEAPSLFAFTHGRGTWKVELAEVETPCQPERWIVSHTEAGIVRLASSVSR